MPPILYSFRRCPYAMRARLAIRVLGVRVQLRELVLSNKPAAMLAISPKGTVPVLLLNDGTVIDESLDVMVWAGAVFSMDDAALIARNDGEFKQALDRYKYPERFPDAAASEHRAQACAFLAELNQRLTDAPCLSGDEMGVLDWAILPFVRQFAAVDAAWFAQTPYVSLQPWLARGLSSDVFGSVMHKYAPWREGDAAIEF